MALTGAVAGAYDATGAAWEHGAGPVYNRLAEVAVGLSPVAWGGRLVLDVGAGTGAAGRAVRRAGARPVALDLAHGMLVAGRGDVPCAVVGDARWLPFPSGAFGGAVAAFSLNHLPEPTRGLAEVARVVGPGGPIVVTSYAQEDSHPVRAAVEQAVTEAGWRQEPWYAEVRETAVPRLATAERLAAAAAGAGIERAEVHAVEVDFPDLGARELVAWRLGMAQHAPFVATLPAGRRAALAGRAVELLGDGWPVLRRSILVLAATAY